MTSIDASSFQSVFERGAKRPKDPSFGLGSRVALGFVFALLLVGGIGGWAATAKLSGAVISPGTVKVSQHVKEVQHRDGGIISEIAVREGDTVTAGQVLLRLDDVQTRAELAIILSQLDELGGRAARLQAERDGSDTLVFQEPLADIEAHSAIVDGEIQLFRGNLLSRNRQKEQLGYQLEQLEEEIRGLHSQSGALTEEVTLVEAEQTKLSELVRQQLTEGSKLYSINREHTRMIGDLAEVSSSIARAEGRIGEVRLQILAIDETARNEAQRELRSVQASLGELAERRRAAEDRLARADIRSPIDGVVNELNVTTIGGVITPAESLVTIVPLDSDLGIEFRLRTMDVDQVSLGQPVKLRFSAFNQRTTPELDGEITHVSAAAQRDPSTGELFYLAEAKIGGDIATLGPVDLLPGMPVEVFAQTDEVTALSYLVKPFTDQIARAFREE